LVVGLMTNSLGILSEAAHSGLDLVAAVMTYIAVTIAERPPDKEHQYGHAKIENLSAFLETLLLVVTCFWIIKEAAERLLTRSTHVEVNVWGYAVIIIAIIVDISRSRALMRVARKHNSQALEADALHFSSDVWSSLVVLAGLVLVSFGYIWFDALAAMAVAMLVLFVSYRLGRRTIDALMDRVPEGLYEDILRLVHNVEGVEEVRSIRLRPSGAHVFVEATVAIPRTIPFQQVHIVTDNIERAIRSRHPNSDVIVHAEPLESRDESIADKIRMIASEKGIRTVHNLEIHQTDGKYYIDFDIEYQKGKSFVEAHSLTSEIEQEIRSAIYDVSKVTIHMEEQEVDGAERRSEPSAPIDLREQIRWQVLQDRRVLGCTDVSMLKVDDRYNLSLTCQFNQAQSLDDIHQIICELETKLYDKFKVIRRITVHAEPKA
jgi:cation diffusion facilitator family transporter